ncbi:MAG: DUF2834 domain-containing protein [Symploca sp. SIO3E6]|nr:DUF2834 domain-containing protein [Caldora sp. SIO3E6]
MIRKIGFWLLWLGFIAYAFLLAPPDQPDTAELIANLSSGKWQDINPLVVCLFNLMGIWPIIYSCLILVDGRQQKLPAWPFATASFGVGAFAILPYLALREPNQKFTGSPGVLLKFFDSRWFGIALTLGAIVLLSYGFSGDWGDFIKQWQTSRFIHVMSLDFGLLSLLFPLLLGDDVARRGMKNSPWFWVLESLPLLGALLYLSFRSPLPNEEEEATTGKQQPV